LSPNPAAETPLHGSILGIAGVEEFYLGSRFRHALKERIEDQCGVPLSLWGLELMANISQSFLLIQSMVEYSAHM
jgi:hypothetical protein